jgi:hypothetical protein
MAGRIAADILWAFSGHRFGVCPLTIRPCTQPQRCPLARVWSGPYGWTSSVLQPWIGPDGLWRNGCGGCAGECGCSKLCTIRLDGPVHQVTQVVTRGAVVPDTAWVVYAFDEGVRLVRTDGQCWLDCQDLNQPDDGAGALAVSYLRGTPVPEGGRRAAAILAWEIAQACMNRPCRLPTRVSQVVREGITYSFIDPLSMFKDNRVGLPEVDMWLASVNPHSVVRPMGVFSPDLRRGAQVLQSNPSPWRNVPPPGGP